MSKMLRFVGLGLRLGVCGGSVLYMHEQGVFGDIKQVRSPFLEPCFIAVGQGTDDDFSSRSPVT